MECKMTTETFSHLIFAYVVLNIVLFVLFMFTKRIKIMHRIFSLIDNLLLAALFAYGFWRINHLLVILVPCIFLVVYPIAWGLNEELNDEDADSLVYLDLPIHLNKKSEGKLKFVFIQLAYFPFYYLLKSWSHS